MRGRRPSAWYISVVTFAIAALSAAFAQAQLRFFYDPATGNVAFDTSLTRSGHLHTYGLNILNVPVSWEFRWENQIRLSTSTLYLARPYEVSDSSYQEPFRGLYTIGDVLPIGLPPQDLSLIKTSYADVIGGGEPLPAEFTYGPPEGEFDNKWDLVDPDMLTWATNATLIYRAWNGEVLIDTTSSTSGYISGFRLISNSGIIAEEYAPFLDVPLTGVEDDTVFMFADAIEPGIYSIGKISPSGLTSSQFAATFEETDFLGRAGFQGGSFDFDADGMAMTLHFVPEPSSLLLLGAGVMCGVAQLRRSGFATCVGA